ncbi:MAG: hypothetical protein M3Q92_04155 [Actinomycetota bacterium]|nr:hypothetical protein [Actinomycetota bacterium]
MAPVGKNGRVLETGADAVAACERPLGDRPAGDAVAVVDLLEPDRSAGEGVLHGGCVCDRIVGVDVERLDQDADAPIGEAGVDGGVRVGELEQGKRVSDHSRPVCDRQADEREDTEVAERDR